MRGFGCHGSGAVDRMARLRMSWRRASPGPERPWLLRAQNETGLLTGKRRTLGFFTVLLQAPTAAGRSTGSRLRCTESISYTGYHAGSFPVSDETRAAPAGHPGDRSA